MNTMHSTNNLFKFGVTFILIVISVVENFPLHASCKIEWTFGASCQNISVDIVGQIKKWHGDDNCKNSGEKCLYTLKSSTDKKIEATHKTPAKHYVDDLTFDLADNGAACTVQGYSTSETWYAVLDKGTNYCNLHNLITGAGLDKTQGYKEDTSSSECTQYSSADCDKY